jgi:hypothetical protein
MLTDAAGTLSSTTWHVPNGIEFTISSIHQGCSLTISQHVARVVAVDVSQPFDNSLVKDLAQKVAELLSSPDLRDYAQVGRILGSNFYVAAKATQQNGLLNEGGAILERIIPGLISVGIWARDSGWVSPPSFFAAPRHLAARTAQVVISVDDEGMCLSSSQLAYALRGMKLLIQETRIDHGLLRTYEINGINRITLSAGFDADDCVADLNFNQVTDAANSVSAPVRFNLAESWTPSTGQLTAVAEHKIALLAARLRTAPGPTVRITALPGAHVSTATQAAVFKLQELVRNSLKCHGFKLPVEMTSGPRDGLCFQVTKSDPAAVCVDAWL